MHAERCPDQSLETLAARLRALPPPDVPADLEARLLARAPASRPGRSRRTAVWAGAVGLLAAACLLALLAGSGHEDGERLRKRPATKPTEQVAVRPTDDAANIGRLVAAQRNLEVAAMPPFAWPLPATASLSAASALPADLLD